MKRVAIVTINYNSHADTVALLKSLLPQLTEKDAVFVLDNASETKDFAALKSFADDNSDKVDLIKSEKNLGFSAGNNFVYEKVCCEFEFVLFANNDTIAYENLLENLLVCAKKHRTGALTGAIYNFPQTEKLWNAGGKLTWLDRKYYSQKKVERESLRGKKYIKASFITGCLMLLDCKKAQKILQHGKLFDERFFFGQEDFNLCVRLKRAKVEVGTALEAVLYHKVSATVDKAAPSKLNKNILHFTMRVVDRRNLCGGFNFALWYAVYMVLLRVKLRVGGYSCKDVKKILRGVRKYSKGNHVDKKVFEKILRG